LRRHWFDTESRKYSTPIEALSSSAPRSPARARAVVRTAPNKTDPNNEWINQLRERRGFNRATVAVANKNARIIWAVLRTGEPYRAAC
jgi:hypothetical protein